MFITALDLETADLSQERAFSTQTLGLSLREATAVSFTVQAGTTALTFRPSSQQPLLYRFAFTIPLNTWQQAKAWLRARTVLLEGEGADEFKSERVRTRSYYFPDPAAMFSNSLSARTCQPEPERTLEHLWCSLRVGNSISPCIRSRQGMKRSSKNSRTIKEPGVQSSFHCRSGGACSHVGGVLHCQRCLRDVLLSHSLGTDRKQNTIVYLIGYAGTGKYTIAKELARLTGAVIVDNHLINNPVFSVIGISRNTPLPAGVWQKIERIRRIVLDTIADLAPPETSFLLTNEFFEGKPMDRRWYEDVAILATRRQARLVPVILRCDPEEVCRRVISPERALRFKERSADRTRENIRTSQLLRVDHPNCLELEITNLSPLLAAQAILAHAERK